MKDRERKGYADLFILLHTLRTITVLTQKKSPLLPRKEKKKKKRKRESIIKS